MFINVNFSIQWFNLILINSYIYYNNSLLLKLQPPNSEVIMLNISIFTNFSPDQIIHKHTFDIFTIKIPPDNLQVIKWYFFIYNNQILNSFGQGETP